MRKIIFIFCILPGFIMQMGTVVYAQEDMTRIDNTVFQKPVRTPSVFPHDTHNEKADIEDCSTCHHIYINGELLEDESSEDQRCSDCHSLESTGESLPLRKAFHKNCKTCHRSRKSGPIMCGECHKKNKK